MSLKSLFNGKLSPVVRVVAVALVIVLGSRGGAQAQSGCCTVRGNVDCDPGGIVDIADLTRLIDHMLVSLNPLCCPEAGNIDGDPGNIVDIVDLTRLIDFMFVSLSPLTPCSGGSFMDPAIRMAAIDLATAKALTLDWSNLNNANTQLASFLNTLPEIDTAAVNGEVANVWALFTDGVLCMFVNNRGPATNSTGASTWTSDSSLSDRSTVPIRQGREQKPNISVTNAAGDALPLSVQARLVETLGSRYTPATATIRAMLTSNGYLPATPTSGTVNGLKLVRDDGVLYYDGHGGAGFFNAAQTDSAFGLWTTTVATAANLPSYSADFVAHRVCLMVAAVGVDSLGNDINEVHYGITSKFVTWYWQAFAQNAMVFIDACGAGGAYAAPFRNAIIAKNASVYFGWTRPVFSDAAALVAKFMFDRMIGANTAAPKETPPQRPFTYPDIYGDLTNRGLHIHPSTDGTTTTFRYFGGPGAFGLLAPSISFMSMEEVNDLIHVYGKFGPDPGADGRVKVDGVELTVQSWAPTEIICDIERTGTGSAGPVTVEVRGDYSGTTPLTFRKSNVVNLTHWKIPFHYDHFENDQKIVVDMDLHIRADVHSHREVPHEAPIEADAIVFDHALNSLGSFSASGTAQLDCATQTWSGGGILEVPENTQGINTFYGHGSINAKNKNITILLGSLFYEGANSHTCTALPCPNDCTDNPLGWAIDIALYESMFPSPYFTMYLNPNFDLLSGERLPTGPYPVVVYGLFQGVPYVKLDWPAVVADFPPDKDAAQ